MRAARDAANLGSARPCSSTTSRRYRHGGDGVRAVAVTLPGFGGICFDPTLEAYAAYAGEVVFGEHDGVGLTPAERTTLESCPTTRLHFAPDAGHMLINQQPDWIAELIVDALARYADQTRQDARSRTARSTLR